MFRHARWPRARLPRSAHPSVRPGRIDVSGSPRRLYANRGREIFTRSRDSLRRTCIGQWVHMYGSASPPSSGRLRRAKRTSSNRARVCTSGNSEKSRSRVNKASTPWATPIATIRASSTIPPTTGGLHTNRCRKSPVSPNLQLYGDAAQALVSLQHPSRCGGNARRSETRSSGAMELPTLDLPRRVCATADVPILANATLDGSHGSECWFRQQSPSAGIPVDRLPQLRTGAVFNGIPRIRVANAMVRSPVRLALIGCRENPTESFLDTGRGGRPVDLA